MEIDGVAVALRQAAPLVQHRAVRPGRGGQLLGVRQRPPVPGEIFAQVQRDPYEPGLQMLLILKGLAAEEQLLKDILGHVLGIVGVAGVVDGHAVNGVRVVIKCIGERRILLKLTGHGFLSLLSITHMCGPDYCTHHTIYFSRMQGVRQGHDVPRPSPRPASQPHFSAFATRASVAS